VTYIITQSCVDVLDRTCIGECPVDAIYFEDDLPGESNDYRRVNVEFFTHLGSPGGASGTGKIHSDHPIVATVPRQPARF
jgi:ferredoxin